jgi:hypothetical protein
VPVLECVMIVKWSVDNGPPRTVRYEDASPYRRFVEDGARITDTQTILEYINSIQDPTERDELLELARKGLITLEPAAQIKLVRPRVPPP